MGDVRDAIVLSLEGALLSAALSALLVVPLAYGLARTTFPGKGVVFRSRHKPRRGAKSCRPKNWRRRSLTRLAPCLSRSCGRSR
jgi:hypothetical protein